VYGLWRDLGGREGFRALYGPHTGYGYGVAVLTPPKLDRDGISTVSDAALAIAS
jgi:hypothetical protein